MLFPVLAAESLLEQMDLVLCLLPAWLLDSYPLQPGLGDRWSVHPTAHHTHRLLLTHLRASVLLEVHSTGYRAERRRQGLSPPLLTETFLVGDSQAARAAHRPLFNLLCSAGKLIPVCLASKALALVNHSHLQGTRVSRRHLYHAEHPLTCSSHLGSV